MDGYSNLKDNREFLNQPVDALFNATFSLRPERGGPGPSNSRTKFLPSTHLGLRSVLAMSLGGLGFVAAIVSAIVVGTVVDRRLRADIGAEFAVAAERVADLLDRGLFERLRDIQVAATLDTIRDGAATAEARRAVLRRLQETYPDYAILFLVAPNGRIMVTSLGVLEGADVSRREYFLRGLEGPFVGDVHDAALMAPILGRPSENPPRFVDLSAPIRTADGEPGGVVAAHLFWEWAESVERDVMASVRSRHPGAETLLLSREGKVLLGPPALRGTTVDQFAPGVARELPSMRVGSYVEADSQISGKNVHSFLIGFAATQGWRTYPGLGWTVLVRHDADTAFAPAAEQARTVMAWGALAAVSTAILGWFLAGLIARPLTELGRAAQRLENDPEAVEVPLGKGPREVVFLASALAALVEGVRGREAALRGGATRLRLATEGAGFGAWELDLISGSSSRSPRHDEIFGYAEPPEGWRFETFNDLVADEDRNRLSSAVQDAISTRTEWRCECRIHRASDGELRWIGTRGAPLLNSTTDEVSRYAGVVEDVTERKEAERALELLVRELDHRVKNQFAVFDGLVHFTARGAPDPLSMARVLRGRVRALAAAHDLVREASSGGGTCELQPTTLAALVRVVLGPFNIDGEETTRSQAKRVSIIGPDVRVGSAGAAALALALHELATNAVRHGSLSCTQGQVFVYWSLSSDEGDSVQLVWRETGGPVVKGEPGRPGFGSTLVRQSVTGQLGGRATLDWSDPNGLFAVFDLPSNRLMR